MNQSEISSKQIVSFSLDFSLMDQIYTVSDSQVWIGYRQSEGDGGGYEWVDGNIGNFYNWETGYPGT